MTDKHSMKDGIRLVVILVVAYMIAGAIDSVAAPECVGKVIAYPKHSGYICEVEHEQGHKYWTPHYETREDAWLRETRRELREQDQEIRDQRMYDYILSQ